MCKVVDRGMVIGGMQLQSGTHSSGNQTCVILMADSSTVVTKSKLTTTQPIRIPPLGYTKSALEDREQLVITLLKTLSSQ